ncbi:MAG: FAD/NAD(P)-binding protein [Myxococcales bacterium]|nr:FAD/NAD(P)-binding protein [Myxococcales bacterium]MDD9967359.1 FAD/NAD(P)-binding protein [Myxococcales bacterium]
MAVEGFVPQDGSDPMVPEPYRIVERRRETSHTVTLALSSAGEVPTRAFQPGQFSMLYAFGLGEVPISISGSTARRDRLEYTIRGVGAVSKALCETPVGAMLGVRGPFGTAWPVAGPENRDLLIVAGGIGLAPLRSVIYQVLERRSHFGNAFVLIGARTEADLLFRDEYPRWRAAGLDTRVTLDAASGSWKGSVGVVTSLFPNVEVRPNRTVAMLCGPEVMMRFAAQALRDKGLSPHDIYVSMERNMKCAVGFCGRCQYGADFICRDGPVLPFGRLEDRLVLQEV